MTQPEKAMDEAMRYAGTCGYCDGGLPMTCTCPTTDPRVVISDLLDLVRELTRQRDDARDLAVRSGIFESWQALTQHDDETGD